MEWNSDEKIHGKLFKIDLTTKAFENGTILVGTVNFWTRMACVLQTWCVLARSLPAHPCPIDLFAKPTTVQPVYWQVLWADCRKERLIELSDYTQWRAGGPGGGRLTNVSAPSAAHAATGGRVRLSFFQNPLACLWYPPSVFGALQSTTLLPDYLYSNQKRL